MRSSNRIRKYPQRYDPGFGASRDWENGSVTSLVYMICDGVYDTNVDTNNILYLLAEWYSEYFIDTPSILLMR